MRLASRLGPTVRSSAVDQPGIAPMRARADVRQRPVVEPEPVTDARDPSEYGDGADPGTETESAEPGLEDVGVAGAGPWTTAWSS
ncbi:MAG: hypothetical protein ACTH0C_08810, partial [Actinomycetaceae bacterium]